MMYNHNSKVKYSKSFNAPKSGSSDINNRLTSFKTPKIESSDEVVYRICDTNIDGRSKRAFLSCYAPVRDTPLPVKRNVVNNVITSNGLSRSNSFIRAVATIKRSVNNIFKEDSDNIKNKRKSLNTSQLAAISSTSNIEYVKPDITRDLKRKSTNKKNKGNRDEKSNSFEFLQFAVNNSVKMETKILDECSEYSTENELYESLDLKSIPSSSDASFCKKASEKSLAYIDSDCISDSEICSLRKKPDIDHKIKSHRLSKSLTNIDNVVSYERSLKPSQVTQDYSNSLNKLLLNRFTSSGSMRRVSSMMPNKKVFILIIY